MDMSELTFIRQLRQEYEKDMAEIMLIGLSITKFCYFIECFKLKCLYRKSFRFELVIVTFGWIYCL